MDKLTALTAFSTAFVFIICFVALRFPELGFFDVMVDRHGRWRIPTSGGPTKAANAIIKAFPRLDGSFSKLEDASFDMDNEGYLESNVIYIVLFGIIGVVIAIIVFSIIIGRYCCNCCGGKDVRRKGYPENQINFFRYAIIIISFFLEAILIYGYFANTDLHTSLSTLTDSFENVSNQILNQMNKITLPDDVPEIEQENLNITLFREDFAFSARYASGQADSMKSFLDKFETWRMVIIIANLVAATFGCSLGIAAGSVRKGTPVLIMVILFAVADLLFFISFGIHFAGSKIIYEFCDEIQEYISDEYDDMIPMRLQYFIPCVNSPVFPFVKNNFYFWALKNVSALNQKLEASGNTNYTYPADWSNVTEYYSIVQEIGTTDIKETYEQTVNATTQMTIIEQSVTCRWSRNELKQDQWLLCTYAKDNLDMIMLTQLAGCIVLFVLTILGIPAIKRFKFAGNANLGGVLDGNKGFMNKHAKAKR